MRKLLYIFAVLAVAYVGFGKLDAPQAARSPELDIPQAALAPDSASQSIAAAYRDQVSNIQVAGSGQVVRVLSDDTEGSRHQRFILRLDSGQTLLVAHNIDLVPRVAGLSGGDAVEFNGEYEWNAQGGVVHWTHHDPSGAHVAGWLKHNGRTYQ
ncbi:MAG: DUF3465 domain-containing protein [Rugosibacter sp.]|nr:DUF3465 domain-containing protein [Rugosibacter sp.]